jgi:peptidoglycan/xylan/chitin deacetylase (PgdA/CDA1 family)
MTNRHQSDRGILLISLDFELAWGIHDTLSLDSYRENLLGVRRVIPELLRLFSEYDISATWATVGFLFFATRDELLAGLPVERPQYADARLSSYRLLETLGADERDDPLHYGASLIDLIRSHPKQEIGSHTFSHYYCLEPGQTAASFRADLQAAIAAAHKRSVRLESLVFPKNQLNPGYLGICRELGMRAIRGTPPSWIHRPTQSALGRAVRLADTYVNLSGRNCYATSAVARDLPLDLPASRFLRPCSKRLRMLEGLRLRRIRSELSYAARRKQVYHLWWHPHNFGANTDANLAFLTLLLDHFARLRDAFGMESLNMGGLARRLLSEAGGRP